MPLTYFVHISDSLFGVFISKADWRDGVQDHYSLISGEAWAYHMGVF